VFADSVAIAANAANICLTISLLFMFHLTSFVEAEKKQLLSNHNISTHRGFAGRQAQYAGPQ
jgi:hypothetical protein